MREATESRYGEVAGTIGARRGDLSMAALVASPASISRDVWPDSGLEALRKLEGLDAAGFDPGLVSGKDLETLARLLRWAESELRGLREREGRLARIMGELEATLARRSMALRKAKTRLRAQVGRIETLQELILRDSLTGLYNRRYWLEASRREHSRAIREKTALSVVVIDIDHFKHVNDTYGHNTGDRVLASLGELLLRSIRQTDVACRVGGEEFILALPASSLEDTCKRADAIRGAFEETVFTFEQAKVRLTFSAGVATFPDHGKGIDEVVLCADRALYRAKNGGRNRIERWS